MRNLIIVFFLLSFTSILAQKKYFKSAIDNGRIPGQFYNVNLSSSQVLSAEKLESYADKKNYILKGVQYQTVNRFGDKGKGVRSFYFLPYSEIEKYIFEGELGRGMVKPNQYDKILSSPKGSAYVYHPFERKFTYKTEIRWTGTITNGKINGNGIGYAKNNNEYWLISGQFKDGKPFKGCNFKVLYTTGNKSVGLQKTDMKSVFIAEPRDGLAAFKVGYKIGFIDLSYNIKIQPEFIKILEEFNNGRAVVKNIKGEEIIIDKSGNKVDFTQNQKLAFLNQAKSIRQLAEYKKSFPDINFNYNQKILSTINSNDDIKYLNQLTTDKNIIMQAKTKIDNSMWDSTIQVGSQAAYNLYLENAPLKLHAAKAKGKIKLIQQKEQDRLEKIRIAKLEKEKKAKEEEQRKRREKQLAIKRRADSINAISPGKTICYSEDWSQSDQWFGISYKTTYYTMRAVLIADDVKSNGMVRFIVNNVESTNSEHYSSIKIGNLDVREKDIIYFSKQDLINNTRFQYCK